MKPKKGQKGRILALDVGQKRIGVAVSDPLGLTAQGLEVIIRKSRDKDLERLIRLGRAYEVKKILVGLPRHLNGRVSQSAGDILALAREVAEALEAELLTWDERWSTLEAERLLIHADLSRARRRQVVDQVAAALILQAYLDAAACQAEEES